MGRLAEELGRGKWWWLREGAELWIEGGDVELMAALAGGVPTDEGAGGEGGVDDEHAEGGAVGEHGGKCGEEPGEVGPVVGAELAEGGTGGEGVCVEDEGEAEYVAADGVVTHGASGEDVVTVNLAQCGVSDGYGLGVGACHE